MLARHWPGEKIFCFVSQVPFWSHRGKAAGPGGGRRRAQLISAPMGQTLTHLQEEMDQQQPRRPGVNRSPPAPARKAAPRRTKKSGSKAYRPGKNPSARAMLDYSSSNDDASSDEDDDSDCFIVPKEEEEEEEEQEEEQEEEEEEEEGEGEDEATAPAAGGDAMDVDDEETGKQAPGYSSDSPSTPQRDAGDGTLLPDEVPDEVPGSSDDDEHDDDDGGDDGEERKTTTKKKEQKKRKRKERKKNE